VVAPTASASPRDSGMACQHHAAGHVVKPAGLAELRRVMACTAQCRTRAAVRHR
jgi:hypothetical protein